MKKYDLLSEIRRRRKWQQMGQQAHKYKNLLNMDFHASKPNSKWVTDISYIHTRQGVLYLSMIRDLYDNSIVAYKTGTEQTVNLVLDTIRLAMKQEKEKVAVELQLHSDFLFLLLHCQTNGVQNQIHRLFRSGFVGHNAIVIEIPNHGQVQHALPGVNVRDVRYPFAVWLACVKVHVQ